ncbi:MAG: cobalt ECF transporter T component CbiQ [Thermoproteota archaeon]|nr:MAG: cobalt ECF transporter T component CbiQ [Candidatus Korarchaeota archaeon]
MGGRNSTLHRIYNIRCDRDNPCCPALHSYRKNYGEKMKGLAERTIEEAMNYFKRSMRSEFSRERGLLQSIDPASCLISSLIFLFASISCRNFEQIFLLFFASILIAISSRISLRRFLARTLFFIPIFTFIVMIPSMFSWITPGKAMLSFYSISITEEGIKKALLFTARVTVAISFPIVATMAFEWDDLMEGLRILKIPDLIIRILLICYRYTFLIANIAVNMLISRRARILSKESWRTSWRWGGEAGRPNVEIHDAERKCPHGNAG